MVNTLDEVSFSFNRKFIEIGDQTADHTGIRFKLGVIDGHNFLSLNRGFVVSIY